MTKQIRVISDSDWEVLKRIVAANQNLQQTPANRPTDNSQFRDGDDSMAPESYIAYPDTADGIPPLVGSNPGSAYCRLYKIVDVANLPTMIPVPGVLKKVYNLTSSAITQSWINIGRDKFGKWIALVNGAGSAPIVRFSVIEKVGSDPGVCICSIQSRPCGSETLPEENEGIITVYDFSGCLFNEPSVHLPGRQGWATLMNPSELVSGTSTATFVSTGTGTGSVDDGTCVWEVLQLCCP